MECDKAAQDLLDKEETNELFIIRGNECDPSRRELIEIIISIISVDTPIERVNRDVKLLGDVNY